MEGVQEELSHLVVTAIPVQCATCSGVLTWEHPVEGVQEELSHLVMRAIPVPVCYLFRCVQVCKVAVSMADLQVVFP